MLLPKEQDFIKKLESRISLYNLVSADYKVKKEGQVYRVIPCPVCGSHDHFTLYPKTNSYSSFAACCSGGGVYKYLTEVKGLEEIAAMEELKRLANYNDNEDLKPLEEDKTKEIPKYDYTNFINNLFKKQTQQDKAYFFNRGLSEEIINKYKLCVIENLKEIAILANPDSKVFGKHAIIPISQNNKILYYTARDLEANPKIKYKKAIGEAIYLNIDYLKTAAHGEVIVICEGEFDSLSLEAVGIKSIAIGGIEHYQRFKDLASSRQDLLFLTAFDNDKQGQKVQSDYKIKIPEKYKDINEWFIASKSDFKGNITSQVKCIIEEARHTLELKLEVYKGKSITSYLKTFRKNIKSNNLEIKTGFKELDIALGGGLYDGLYVVGAISSLGKTSWILQMADQLAQSGQDVLYFSLEMSRDELIAKSISRLTFLNADTDKEAKTTRGILSTRRYNSYSTYELELIEACINKYSNYSDNLYINEGLGDIGVKQIREAVEDHITITKRKPVVIIDYLQILAPFDFRATDKQNTDKSVLSLKRLSREFKLPIIAISSLNRASYSSEIDMSAFKESGAVEYGSDVLIGLQFRTQKDKDFDVDKEKSKNIRDIQVKILKQRNERTGIYINYEYYCMFNYFQEIAADEPIKIIKKR